MSLNNAVIANSDISTPKKDALAHRKTDRVLVDKICNFRKEMERNGYEVYKRWDNVIVTESGWYYSFYESDMEEVKKAPPPKPYKGEDGRMKVDLIRTTGEHITEDLATMVATGFIPNPEKYQYVGFKDGNAENCKADNLVWVKEP